MQKSVSVSRIRTPAKLAALSCMTFQSLDLCRCFHVQCRLAVLLTHEPKVCSLAKSLLISQESLGLYDLAHLIMLPTIGLDGRVGTLAFCLTEC